MAVKCEEYNHVCVMTPGGDLVAAEAQAARKAVESLVIDRKRLAGFVLDCERVGFVDSEGLETLIWIKRHADNARRQFKLANLDDNCRKILQVTRLDHRFECHHDLATALKSIR
jgi:anti-anti-sigma factor